MDTNAAPAVPAMYQAQFLRQVEGMPDARGDRALYPKGWVGPVDAEFAVYVAAMGYAWPVGEWPDELEASVAVVRAIVDLFRAANIEPTQADVTRELMARLALAEQQVLANGNAGSDAAVAQTSAAPPPADQPKAQDEPAPIAAGQPKARRK